MTDQKIEQWEEAWSDYVSALDLGDLDFSGEDAPYWDAPYWAGVAERRLADATRRLRQLDPSFCDRMGI